jgi:FAD synthase
MKLAEPVILGGVVTHFKGDGRKLGYPTANIDAETNLQDGVYFGHANLSEWPDQPSLIFIGVPTTMGETKRRVEAHLLDISDQDYYDLPLSLSIEYFHRPNQNFASMDELMKVMKQDEAAARDWFENTSSGSGRI